MSTEFEKKVQDVVRHIPKGSVLSYGQVATAAGRPRAFRAVGTIMRKNRNPQIPCHRVVRSDGSPGGYNGGELEKELKLRSEEARFDTGKEIKYTITRKFGGED
jgi:O-6-methylguanine DNA methyltransferase